MILFLDPDAVLNDIESQNAGGKLKESGTTHWESPNTGATNESRFTGLPGGTRYGGSFSLIGQAGLYWCSDVPVDRYLNYQGILVLKGSMYPNVGYSVRCLKD
jgi:hypothetical protein